MFLMFHVKPIGTIPMGFKIIGGYYGTFDIISWLQKMNSFQLRQAQFDLGLTDEEMAIRLNTPVSTYRKWKQGQRRVPGLLDVAFPLIFPLSEIFERLHESKQQKASARDSGGLGPEK